MSIEHKCDECPRYKEADHCLCEKHLDEKLGEAYKDGYRDGELEGRKSTGG